MSASRSAAMMSDRVIICAQSSLTGSPVRKRHLITRTSVLDRMCGSVCDAILGQKGSAAVLEQMEARNLLVVPLGRRRECYRYHHLLRDLLRAELWRREPGLIQDLHFRAAASEANGMPEAAIDHAQAAGDYDRVARLILET